MANQQLVDYIKTRVAASVSRETVKAALLGAGWPAADVEAAFSAVYGLPAASQPSRSEQQAQMEAAFSQPLRPTGAPSGISQPSAGPQAQPAREKPSFFGAPSSGAVSPAVAPVGLGVSEAPKKKAGVKSILIVSLVIVVVLALAGAGWYFFLRTTPQPEAPSIPETTPAPVIPPLSIEQIKNAAYVEEGKQVQLKEGSFTGNLAALPSVLPLGGATSTITTSTGAASASKTGKAAAVTTTISFYKVALGDLNGDGLGDAVVILTRNDGGSESFRKLIAFLNDNGQPAFVDSTSLGDRVMIDSVLIENGAAVVSMVVPAAGDATSSPTQKVIKKFKLIDGKITEQELILGWRLFSKTLTDSAKKISLTYEFSYPGDGFTVKAETQSRIVITDKKISKNNVLVISDETVRKFTTDDYWIKILKKSCAGCSVASSTGGSITTMSTTTAATSTSMASIITIAGSRNILVAENKTNKWVVWDSPADAPWLFAAYLLKPADDIEKILNTFKFSEVNVFNASTTPR